MLTLLIAATALLASLLTFFSGFGLGTLLSPVLAIFFPVQIAIAATAIVHLANNLFKLALMYRHVELGMVLHFALPAALAAIPGALVLSELGQTNQAYQLSIFGYSLASNWLNLVVGLIFIGFSLTEISGVLKKFQFAPKWLFIGGITSGFFGGLSGNQGAFRSAFLVKCQLSKESFIATGVVTACAVDLMRISVYFASFSLSEFSAIQDLNQTLLVAILAAFTGAYLGKRWLHKTRMETIRVAVAGLMIMIGLGLCLGLIGH